MSLWWTGPDAASVNLEAPKAVPNSSQRVPRLMKTVTNNRFIHVACGGGHAMAITHDGRPSAGDGTRTASASRR